MSCTRPPNFLLRKQKSLVCESVCRPTINSDRRYRLQKQFSVDHNRDKIINNQLKNGQHNSWACNNSSPESSLRIFTAIKSKTQNGTDTNTEYVQIY